MIFLDVAVDMVVLSKCGVSKASILDLVKLSDDCLGSNPSSDKL